MANGEIKPDSKLLMIIILICVEADEDLFVNGNCFYINTVNSKKIDQNVCDFMKNPCIFIRCK